MSTPDSLPESTILADLAEGQLALEGRFVYGSNFTFLVRVQRDGHSLQAVYKPSQGERPLWDFPEGTLAARETAAYIVSHMLGWDLVPPTVMRDEGPSGPGSVQLFVDADPDRHYFTMDEADKHRLIPAAVFDALINNADRKGGHVLFDSHDHLWLIDHGVCFHAQPKLRTVIWDFAGQAIPSALLEDLSALRAQLEAGGSARRQLALLLTEREIDALLARALMLIQNGCMPTPGPDRHYPWPLV
jgi:uncharacterized repeat protein (TIGR03843 family)